jgi:hypothetical protein
MTSSGKRFGSGSSTACRGVCAKTRSSERPSRRRRSRMPPGASDSLSQVDDLIAYLRALATRRRAGGAVARTGHAVAERRWLLSLPRSRADAARDRIPGASRVTSRRGTGRDFPELVLDEAEAERVGSSVGGHNACRRTPIARFFLDRQAIRMPLPRPDHGGESRASRPTSVGCAVTSFGGAQTLLSRRRSKKPDRTDDPNGLRFSMVPTLTIPVQPSSGFLLLVRPFRSTPASPVPKKFDAYAEQIQ